MEWQNASLIGDGSKNSESQRRITEAPIIDLYPKKEFSVPALPFLTVFEKLDIPALVIESDGKIWCVNQLLCKYFGVSEFDCNGKILYSLIPGLKNWVENEMSNCVPAELKLQLDAEAAVKKNCIVYIDPMVTGPQVFFIITLRDVRGDHNADSTYLHKSPLNLAINAIPGPALITRNNVIVYANQQAAVLFGSDHYYELAGQNLSDYFGEKASDSGGILLNSEDCLLKKTDGSSVLVRIESPMYESENYDEKLFRFQEIVPAELQRNKRFELCSMIHQIGDFYCVQDVHGTFEYINAAFTKFLGYENDEITGKHFSFLMQERSAQEKWQEIHSHLQSTGEFAGTILCRKKSGELFYYSLRMGVIKKNCRNSSGYITIGEDATARICAENEHLLKEERLRVIVEHITDIIFVIRGDGLVEYVSPSVFKSLSMLPEDIVDKDFFLLVNEEKKEEISKVFYVGATTDFRTFNFELEIRDKNGYYQTYHAAGEKYYEADRIIKFILVCRNIHQQKQLLDELTGYKDNLEQLVEHRTSDLTVLNRQLNNEISWRREVEQELLVKDERLALALEVSAYGLWDINLETDSIYYNERFADILGVPEGERTGLTVEYFESLIHKDDIYFFKDKFAKHLKGENDLFEIEVRILTKENVLKHISVRGKVVFRDPEGNPMRFIGRVEDISLRRKVEDKLEKALEREKELLDLKTQFISIVSHEYRTPLATILSSAEILEMYDGQLNQQARQEQLKKIELCVDEMSQLLEDVIVINKSDMGKLNHAVVEFDLISFSRNIIYDISGTCKQPPTVHFNALLKKLMVRSSPALYKQILGNLFTNAVKYTPHGKNISVMISARSPYVYLEVQDEGMGIQKDDQKLLFEPFFRGKNVGTISGSGLGLPIVKRSVDALQGKLSFVSQANIGSTFRVELPMEFQL